MRGILVVLTVTAIVGAAAESAAADGARRGWRGSHAVGEISRNVITPYYVGYHGGHYSYYKSAFIPPNLVPPSAAMPEYGCWRWSYDGYRYWAC
jgi:hypothetical protein